MREFNICYISFKTFYLTLPVFLFGAYVTYFSKEATKNFDVGIKEMGHISWLALVLD